jgi:anti-sigma B factor antagonist
MDGSGYLSVWIERVKPSYTAVVEAAGEVDLVSAPELRRVLSEGVDQGPVVLDAANVGSCDCAGLYCLFEAHQAASERGTCLRLSAPSAAVLRMLEVAGVLELFEIFADLESALKD